MIGEPICGQSYGFVANSDIGGAMSYRGKGPPTRVTIPLYPSRPYRSTYEHPGSAINKCRIINSYHKVGGGLQSVVRLDHCSTASESHQAPFAERCLYAIDKMNPRTTVWQFENGCSDPLRSRLMRPSKLPDQLRQGVRSTLQLLQVRSARACESR